MYEIYNHSSLGFSFIKIGKLYQHDSCRYVIYNLKRDRVEVLFLYAETCFIDDDTIDGNELCSLILCCLGSSPTNSLSHADTCQTKFREFLRILIKCEMTLKEIEEHWYDLQNFRHLITIADEHMIETCIDEKIAIEKDRMFLNRNAKIIQNYWRQIICDPQHSFCQKRLLREFGEMNNVI